ncbi:MAG: hypothetical protein FJ271_05140 [Planctomycetes bacterium]|nr:hypothetical protein [Planctomycetota bacterium]
MTRTIRDKFVPVAVSGHVAMNRKDADGEFLRRTGIKLAGAGGNIECLTAGGIRLGAFYAAGGTEVNRRDLENILKKWQALPDRDRKAGAVVVGEAGPVAANITAIAPPAGALILRTYHRVLTRTADGDLRKTVPGDYPKSSGLGDKDFWLTFYGERWEAQPDFMWIQEAEWQAIVRPNPSKGDSYPLLEAVADRMTRAHLTLTMAYGECSICDRKSVRDRSLTLTVTDVTPAAVQLRLEGAAALGADYATSDKLDRKGLRKGRSVEGFEPKVLGYLTFDRKVSRFTRFDVLALGDAYGTPGGDYHFYYRPGRYPVGISLELASGTTPGERIPPRAAVVYDTPNPAYFATGK